MRRVVITGMGVVSPLGNKLEDFWNGLLEGKSGIGPLTKLNEALYKGKCLAAEVKGLDGIRMEMPQEVRVAGKATQYGWAASKMALQDAGLPAYFEAANKVGLVIGTTYGNQDLVGDYILSSREEAHQNGNLPRSFSLSGTRPIDLTALISKQCNLGGTNVVIPMACSAGNYALGIAYAMIKQGRAPIMLAGGADSITLHSYSLFYRLGSMTDKDCRPFDQGRNGIIVGEGAGILILEELEHALARDANIYAEIRGYAIGNDAYHPTSPDPCGSGLISAMQSVFHTSGVSPMDISCINAHGTATKANDSYEARAMAEVFGEALADIPVISIKSMLGHCMGAASAFEAICSALSLKENTSPSTANTQIVDRSFPIQFKVTADRDRKKIIRFILSNAIAMGGNVCSLLLGRFDIKSN